MEANLTMELTPFMVPDYAHTMKLRDGITHNAVAIRVEDLDAETLAGLCEDFTNRVFKKAKKQRPPIAG